MTPLSPHCTVAFFLVLTLSVFPACQTQRPVSLTTADVEIVGPDARVEKTSGVEYVGYWISTNTYVRWNNLDLQPGTYQVDALYALDPQYPGATITVTVAGQTLTAAPHATASWHDYQLLRIGDIKVQHAGCASLLVKATDKPGRFVINLQKITLTPKP